MMRTEKLSSPILKPDLVIPSEPVISNVHHRGATSSWGLVIAIIRSSGLVLSPTRDKSGPNLPPLPLTMWQEEHSPLPRKRARPASALPSSCSEFGSYLKDSMYATSCYTCVSGRSESTGSIAVPGTPFRITLNIPTSLLALFSRPVKSGAPVSSLPFASKP